MRRMARSMIVVRSPASDPAAGDIEIVERKGLGHPDTICDALAEQVSLALSRHYFDRFNRVLHHNVDKILLVGGAARPLLEAAKSSSRSKFAWLVAQRRSTAMSRSRLTISRWVGVDDGCDITSRTWTWIVGCRLRRASSRVRRTWLPSSSAARQPHLPTTRQSGAASPRSPSSNASSSTSNGR